MTHTELIAYCSGFFDGEGTISICRCKPNGKAKGYYRLHIGASQKEKSPLLLLQSVFGGRIYDGNRRGFHCLFQWILTNKAERLRFLQMTIPFLQSKRAEAEIGLQFIATEKPSGHRWHPVTNEEQAFRHSLYERCKFLKRSKVMMEDSQGQFPLPSYHKAFGREI